MKRPLACAVALLIVLLSPGETAYQAFAQTVNKTGASAGLAGDSATAANSGVSNGASPVPIAIPIQMLGLGGSLNDTAPAPAANVNIASVFKPVPLTIVTALQPATKADGGRGGLSTALKQGYVFSRTMEPVLEGVQSGDATSALNVVYENAASRAPGTVPGPLGSVAGLSGGLKKSELSVRPETTAEMPAAAVPVAKTGSWRRIRSTFNLSEFSKSEKSYILGQAVFLLAISVYLASLPLLVKALTGDAAMTGVARMVHYWVFGGASLFAGAVVGKNPMKRILVGAAGGRALLFGSIGALALFGGLPWAGFLALVGVNALIVAHNHLIDIDTGGAAKIFKSADQKSTDHKIEKAGYVYDFIYYGMMLVVPAMIGLPMDWIDGRYGSGNGAAAGFSLFAALMGVVSYIYAKRVVTIGGAVAAPLAGIKDFFKRAISGVRTFGRILMDVPRRNWATFQIILGNKAILARSSMATMENFIEDALFAVVLPTFAIDILAAGAFGNGLLLSSITAGGLVSSVFLMKRIQDLQKKHGTYKVLAGLTAVAALAFVPSIGLWMVPSIGLAIPAVFMMKLMLQPLRSRMRALLQTEIKNDPKAAPHSDDIYSLMTFVEVLAAGAGGLAFAWLFHRSLPDSALALTLGALAPMKIITIALGALGLVYFGGLRWVKQQLSKPTRTVHKSPEGNEAKMLERLSISLKDNGLPAYKTAKVAGPTADDRPTVVILAPASRHKVAIAREGGRQAPGDVNLVLDAWWLIQERHPDGRTKLFVTKGVVFDEKGQAVVVEYESPRRVHYFANFMTLGANNRVDGVPYEENLDVPQSNSLRREDIINDKLGTRIAMAAKGVVVPVTLAFLMSAHPLAAAAANGSLSAPNAAVAMIPEGDGADDRVAAAVDAYLTRLEGDEVVVKPSGTQFHSGIGVKFFKKTERRSILDHIRALRMIDGMTAQGAILLESRVNSAPLERGGRKMETTLRVLVARKPLGGGEVSGVYARVGPWGKPTTMEAADPRDNATGEPWESLLKDWRSAGYLNSTSSREFDEQVRAMGPLVLSALSEYEKKFPRAPGEGYQVSTDMIGLDVMIELRAGKLVPVAIEINDHDSGSQYNLDQMYPKRSGEHSRVWVATMLARARRDALKGKRIVIVGAGYEGKKPVFERARELGVDIILVDSAKSWANDPRYISELIATDNSKPEEALTIARKKLRLSARKKGKIDGITTFWEDDVALTADVAQALGLPYHASEAARTARNKFKTQALLAQKGIPAARQETVSNLSTAADGRARKAMVVAFRRSAAKVGFPAVIKPLSGAEAIGTEKVSSLKEAVAAYKRISPLINPKTDAVFASNSDLLLMQYLDGPEYDVDLVMVAGKSMFASVTDNKLTREPSFLATGSRLPSTLTPQQQKKAVEQAIVSAQALGLSDGVLHMEGKYTSGGPRLIEANARMGGTYVYDWIKGVWGVDLVEEGLMAAARIPGRPYKPAQPVVHLDGDFVNSDKAGVIKVLELPDEARGMPGFIRFRMVKQVGDRITTNEGGGYMRVAMLEVGGKNADEARRNLDAIKAKIRFVVE